MSAVIESRHRKRESCDASRDAWAYASCCRAGAVLGAGGAVLGGVADGCLDTGAGEATAYAARWPTITSSSMRAWRRAAGALASIGWLATLAAWRAAAAAASLPPWRVYASLLSDALGGKGEPMAARCSAIARRSAATLDSAGMCSAIYWAGMRTPPSWVCGNGVTAAGWKLAVVQLKPDTG